MEPRGKKKKIPTKFLIFHQKQTENLKDHDHVPDSVIWMIGIKCVSDFVS